MILVTGANGFLGSKLIGALLDQGEKIRAFVRVDSNLELIESFLPEIELFKGDILDISDVQSALLGIDYIYHCAAFISFSKNDRQKMFKTNVEGTANLVNIALDFPIKKIVYISSIAAIGANPLKGEIDETLNWEKHLYNSEYGLSKQLAEREIIRGVSEGLTATIVNPGIILGEGQWRKTTGRIWESIWNGQFFTIKGQNGFVDIQDVIHFSVAAMKVGKIGNRYILVSENVDYQLLFTQIAKSINKKSRFLIAPILLQKIYVYYDWLKSLITNSSRNLTNETLKISNVKFSFSNKKAIKELGINFTPLNKTIDRISTSFLKTKNVNNNG